jgi:hypothetical protein
MTMHFGDLITQAAADGAISADEILSLRGAGWADGKMDPEEAEALFLANDALTERSPEWCDFFVEALSEFVVNTVEPQGYVDQEMGDELLSRIDRDGKVESLAELELLVRVLEKARSVPQNLRDYALKQLEAAVLSSEGPTRHGELTADGINETECALLRRTIFSSGGDRPGSVSKSEAEMLFRIKDTTLFDTNAPEWQPLFVQGVANYLLGFGGHEPLTPERAGELEKFMNTEGAGIGGFLGRVLTSKPDFSGAFASLLGDNGPDSGIEAFGEEAEAAAVLEPFEADWLNDMLEADEELDELEKALISFIDNETGGQVVPRAQG